MEEDKTWPRILNLIKEQISSANFRTWFSQASLANLKDSHLVISVPSAFIKGQLIARYDSLIKQAASQLLGQKVEIDYQVDASIFVPVAPEEPIEEVFSFSPSSPPTTPTLNPRYSLENFVVGLTNNLAFAAAQAVVQNPGTTYNPLFIYGPSGVGKTHLMQAIGKALASKNPYQKIVYAPSERFMNDFVESIQTKRMGNFRSKYRNCDLFLIDDIQFFSGKDSIQEEFFHTFNEIHAKNLQIVLTSDKAPNEIQRLEPRLQSRFQGGLMVDIQLPDFDTRMAILKAKLNQRGESLPEEILQAIAASIVSNTRELEGKLIQILQVVKLQSLEPSLDNIQKFLGPSQTTNKQLDQKKVLLYINQYFSLKTTDLIGPRRQKELVLPRQLAMYILYTDCRLPFEKIGDLLGGRDHTTIMHGVDKIKQAIPRDREIQRILIEIKQLLIN